MAMTNVSPRFRLLDGFVGWDADAAETFGVSGLDDTHGLRLLEPPSAEFPDRLLSVFVPPAWLSRGRRPYEWFMCVGDETPSQSAPRILRHDSCDAAWFNIAPSLSDASSLQRPVAVHICNRRLALLDDGDRQVVDGKRQGTIYVWSIADGRLIERYELAPGDRPQAIVRCWNEWVVSMERAGDPRRQRLLRIDRTGRPREEIQLDSKGATADKPFPRLATGADGALWAAQEVRESVFRLWRITPRGCADFDKRGVSCRRTASFRVQKPENLEFQRPREDALQKLFGITGLISVAEDRICVKEPLIAGVGDTRCFARNGSSAPLVVMNPPASAAGIRAGVLATRVLDSLIPHCRWHRIRVDADVPSDTAFRIQVASADNDDQPPHLLDWNSLPDNASDQLIDEPPGRFLYVKIALQGTGEASPLIRRVRIDFPRVTSLEQLPTVYREDPDAEDFTERFLSLFDAAMEDLEAAIERFPALLDPAGVPEEVLPWLAAFLGVVFDPAWDTALRRRLLLAAPTLFAQRGTLAGIRNAIEMIFGVRPVIQERVLQRAWGALGADSRLGAVRLFGKSTARFRLGRSALNAASLRSYGNPDHDPLRSEAHRFTVLLPPAAIRDVDGVSRLDLLIAQQKPAHTLHAVRVGGKGFIVGQTSVVGIDTQLLAPDPPVLGSAARPREMPGNTRLSRTSILRPGVNMPVRGVGVGNALVGLNSVLE